MISSVVLKLYDFCRKFAEFIVLAQQFDRDKLHS
jgi:hypothetical protein